MKKFSLILALGVLVMSNLCGPANAGGKVPQAKIADKYVVSLEVASTAEEIERGLMGRTSLPEDAGMVFLFKPARRVYFWMKNCFIPLDMIFVSNGRIVEITENAPPCKAANDADCPRYPSDQGVVVSEVIEVAGGWVKAHGVNVGDSVRFSLP